MSGQTPANDHLTQFVTSHAIPHGREALRAHNLARLEDNKVTFFSQPVTITKLADSTPHTSPTIRTRRGPRKQPREGKTA